MFCTVFRLRHRGNLLHPGDPFYLCGLTGVLTVDRGRESSAVHAVLRDLSTNDELVRLYRARLVKIRAGGILLAGEDMLFQGPKSKGEARAQSWWCVPAGAPVPRPLA